MRFGGGSLTVPSATPCRLVAAVVMDRSTQAMYVVTGAPAVLRKPRPPAIPAGCSCLAFVNVGRWRQHVAATDIGDGILRWPQAV